MTRSIPLKSAVHGLNKVSESVEEILRSDLGMACTHFFEDFGFILPRVFGEPAIQVFRDMLQLLGCAVARNKDPPAPCFCSPR